MSDAHDIQESELAGLTEDIGFSVFDLNLVGTEFDMEAIQEPISPITDEENEPLEPTIDTKESEFADRFMIYPQHRRNPGDVVLSGPVISGWGPGRYFQNRHRAYRHLVMKYGEARVKKLDNQTKGRWAFLIKNLKPGALGAGTC